jgi:ABC-type dipeptide/oligopeptide/nickel transport system permease subunit
MTYSVPPGGEDLDRPIEAENAIELKEIEGLSQGQIVRRRFFRHKGAMISIVVLAFIIVLAFSSVGFDVMGFKTPGWWLWTWTQIPDVLDRGRPTLSLIPEWLGGTGIRAGEHPFGQDEVGRDIFALTMRGTQQSLMILVVVGVVATVIGTILGALSGYYRKWVDPVIMRFTDIVITIPLIVVGAVLGRTFGELGALVLAIIIGLFTWTGLARLVRAEFLSLRMAAAILLEAALSFLGYGVQSPDTSLGKIISDNQAAFSTRPWLFWWPGLFIIAIALCINFIGDGLRDAFDPRQKRVPTDRALRKAGARLDRAATIVSTRGAGMQMGGDGVRGYHADDPDRGDR